MFNHLDDQNSLNVTIMYNFVDFQEYYKEH